jgi:hypothetical protein
VSGFLTTSLRSARIAPRVISLSYRKLSTYLKVERYLHRGNNSPMESEIVKKATSHRRYRLIYSSLAALLFSFCAAMPGHALPMYSYNGVVTLCTGTCASFASLDVGSTLSGMMEIDVGPSDLFGDADIGDFSFDVFNPALPVSGPVGDPVNDNPLILSSVLGIIASNGTAGTTDAASEINGGQMLLEFLTPPFSSNGAFVVFDLSTGNGQLCLFFATAGCIPGATEAVKFEGSFALVSPGPGPGPGIPLPATLALFGLGLVGLGLSRRKRAA